MNLDRVIAVRTNKTVYRDGDKCIKVFDSDYSKADVLNEALNQARIEETGLNIPKVLEVMAPLKENGPSCPNISRARRCPSMMQEHPEKKDDVPAPVCGNSSCWCRARPARCSAA